jgi:hypothetical protein
MSDASCDMAEKGGRLIRFALLPRLLPSGDPEYLGLVREFLSNSIFQDITGALARGLGLRVLSASVQSGLVLGTTADSPFQLHREDYHSRMSASDRIVQGLIHLGIAAWCFPRAEDLREADDVLPARITVEELVEYLHTLCEELKSREERNIAVPSSEVRLAWQHILALGKYSDSADGRGSFATLAGKVRFALNFLSDHGFLKREGSDERPSWLARPSFRIHVRELAGHEAFSIVTRTAQEVSNG